MTMRTAILALAVLCAGISGSAVAQVGSDAPSAVQSVPGSALSLRPFPGYVPAFNFAGFESEATGGSIVVASLPKQVFAELAANADVTRLGPLLEQKGVIVEDAETRTIAGYPGLFIRGRQPGNQLLYRKWIAFIEADQTYIVTVQVPDAHAPQNTEVLDLVASITIGQMPSLADQVAALPFAIGATEPFRVTRIIAGNLLLLTMDDSNAPMPLRPTMIIGTSLGNVPPVAAQTSFAEQRLRSYPDLAVGRILSSADIEEGAEREIEIIAAAEIADTGEDARVVQWIRFQNNRYLIVIGIASPEGWDKTLPQMRAVRSGVAVKADR
jgi:hypothetical protein